MGRIKGIDLSEAQYQELKHAYQTGRTQSYRQRCQGILLKSRKRSSADVARQLGCNEVTVNLWLKRYQQEGIKGLQTRAGRGRKAILDEADVDKVKELVAAHRQKLSVAKGELEQMLGKSFSDDTLKRYVKKTLAVINESESVPSKSRVRSSLNSKSRA